VKTAAQQFKNIQILKDMPADRLIPAMQFITASLGVDCEYCHVRPAVGDLLLLPPGFAPPAEHSGHHDERKSAGEEERRDHVRRR
jgi:hypothetical protein